MKYRKRGKIKREHAIIKDLLELLEQLAKHPEIQSMLPGEIKPVKKPSPLGIRRLMPTHSGWKALFQSGCAVQEVFFVGAQKELEPLLRVYLLDPEPPDESFT